MVAWKYSVFKYKGSKKWLKHQNDTSIRKHSLENRNNDKKICIMFAKQKYMRSLNKPYTHKKTEKKEIYIFNFVLKCGQFTILC